MNWTFLAVAHELLRRGLDAAGLPRRVGGAARELAQVRADLAGARRRIADLEFSWQTTEASRCDLQARCDDRDDAISLVSSYLLTALTTAGHLGWHAPADGWGACIENHDELGCFRDHALTGLVHVLGFAPGTRVRVAMPGWPEHSETTALPYADCCPSLIPWGGWPGTVSGSSYADGRPVLIVDMDDPLKAGLVDGGTGRALGLPAVSAALLDFIPRYDGTPEPVEAIA